MSLTAFLLGALLSGRVIPSGPEVPLPVYSCPRIAREIVLDGRMSDPLWKRAPAVSLVDTVYGGPADQPTEVRLLVSATTLYIGFACADDYVWGTKTEPDSEIYREECVEVFLDPSGGLHRYCEIDVSPKNVVFDALILNPRTPAEPGLPFAGRKDFHPQGLETRAHVEGDADRKGGARSWTVEYAIPLASLTEAPQGPPRAGDAWRMNLYRIDAPEPGRQKFYAWNPTGKIDFHRPWRFGVLKFL
jgi:hypothetical protein